MNYVAAGAFAFLLTGTQITLASDFFRAPTNATHLAQGTAAMCQQALANASNCYRNWQNIGGGSSGQAGSFKECVQVYCQAMTAGGCPMPPLCNSLQ